MFVLSDKIEKYCSLPFINPNSNIHRKRTEPATIQSVAPAFILSRIKYAIIQNDQPNLVGSSFVLITFFFAFI